MTGLASGRADELDAPLQECADGLACVDGQCILEGGSGCADGSACPYGFDCVNANCVAVGTLPAGTVGASCALNVECESGICVGGDGADGYCSQQCTSAQDCPHSAACQDMGGITLCAAPWSALPATPTSAGDGGCQVARRTGGAGTAALLLLLGLALVRRRHAR